MPQSDAVLYVTYRRDESERALQWSVGTRSGYSASMGASFIAYRGNGFWCRDGLLEVWLALVVDEIDACRAAAESPSWLGEDWVSALREHWRDQASVRFDGDVTTSIDDFTEHERQRSALLALVKPLRVRLAAGDLPAEDSFAGVVGTHLWASDKSHAAARLLRFADAFVWLLEGAREPSPAEIWRHHLDDAGADPASV